MINPLTFNSNGDQQYLTYARDDASVLDAIFSTRTASSVTSSSAHSDTLTNNSEIQGRGSAPVYISEASGTVMNSTLNLRLLRGYVAGRYFEVTDQELQVKRSSSSTYPSRFSVSIVANAYGDTPISFGGLNNAGKQNGHNPINALPRDSSDNTYDIYGELLFTSDRSGNVVLTGFNSHLPLKPDDRDPYDVDVSVKSGGLSLAFTDGTGAGSFRQNSVTVNADGVIHNFLSRDTGRIVTYGSTARPGALDSLKTVIRRTSYSDSLVRKFKGSQSGILATTYIYNRISFDLTGNQILYGKGALNGIIPPSSVYTNTEDHKLSDVSGSLRGGASGGLNVYGELWGSMTWTYSYAPPSVSAPQYLKHESNYQLAGSGGSSIKDNYTMWCNLKDATVRDVQVDARQITYIKSSDISNYDTSNMTVVSTTTENPRTDDANIAMVTADAYLNMDVMYTLRKDNVDIQTIHTTSPVRISRTYMVPLWCLTPAKSTSWGSLTSDGTIKTKSDFDTALTNFGMGAYAFFSQFLKLICGVELIAYNYGLTADDAFDKVKDIIMTNNQYGGSVAKTAITLDGVTNSIPLLS